MRRMFLWVGLCLVAGCDSAPDEEEPPPPINLPDPDMAPTPDMALPVDMGQVADATVDPDMALPDAAVDMMVPDLAIDMAIPACADGADNDGDGQTDYPADPGCEGPTDDDEADPEAAACSDGADNDGDGRVDQDDPGCFGPSDPSEDSACGEAEIADVTGQGQVLGDTTGGLNQRNTCRNNLAPDRLFRFTLRTPVERLTIDTRGSAFDTLLGVYDGCAEGALELACDDDGGGARTSLATIEQPALGDYIIAVDGHAEGQGPFVLNIRGELPDGAACVEAGEGPPPAIGCARGRVCRDGVCAVAACANGLDDDGDGFADFPNDPGCEDITDDDETSPEVLPECADGIDNDFDTAIDYPLDPDCTSAADDEEQRPPQCRDGIDNDRDGLIDLDDPGCQGDPDRFSEFNTPACRNFEDDDEDQRIDYPEDPGCESPDDVDETDPADLPACSNGVDDDLDGLTDYPEDVDSCLWAADPDEDDPCDRLEPREITRLTRTAGNTAEETNDFLGSCQGGVSAPEAALVWRAAEDRPLSRLVLDARNSDYDTILFARDSCGPEAQELACDDNGGQILDARIELGPVAAGDEVLIFVDGARGQRGIWRMRIEAELDEGANCGPPGDWVCGAGLDCVETPEGPRCSRARCDNGEDDDGDGLTDFPADPGCEAAADQDEADPPVPPACANGIDDDEDGATDWPDDPRCDAAADDFEGPDCADGIDNDGDGGVDYDRDGDGARGPNQDFECSCATDETEGVEPQCADGCDNDNDGLIDLADPGCDAPDDPSEFNPPLCQDGRDNDGDGLTDFPADPGCNWPQDPDETDEGERACSNGIDDDEDGRIDFPADEDCPAAAGADERGPCGAPLPIFPGDVNVIIDATIDAVSSRVGSCTRNTAPDEMWSVLAPYAGRVVISLEGSGYDTSLYVRRACPAEVVCPDPVDPEPEPVPEPEPAPEPPPEPEPAPEPPPEPEPDPEPPPEPEPEPEPQPEPEPIECVPGPTELACNDDAIGLQSRVDFEWGGGGPLYVVVDGFGSAAGAYRLSVDITYPEGGQCGPDQFAYANCIAGTVCLPDPIGGVPTCQVP